MTRLLIALVCLPGLAPAADLPWLRAEGTKIVDPSGKPVPLRGANLGGWLVEEMWMMPFVTKPPEGSGLPEIRDHASLWKVVEKRLGAEQAVRVLRRDPRRLDRRRGFRPHPRGRDELRPRAVHL